MNTRSAMVALLLASSIGGVAGAALPPIGSAPTRADLAAAYLRIDAAAMDVLGEGVPSSIVAEANRRFDAATMQFFAGRPGDVIASLAELVEWLETATIVDEERAHWASGEPARRLLGALRIDMTAPMVVIGARWPELEVARFHETPSLDDSREHSLVIALSHIAPSGEVERREAARWTLPAPAEQEWSIDLEATLSAAQTPGRWNVEATIVDAELQPMAGPRSIGAFSVVAEAPSATRNALVARFADATIDSTELRQAIASFRGRLELLVDEPSTSSAAHFLAEPHALATQLTHELDRLIAGENPYAETTGDLWRIFEAGDPSAPVRVPARVFVPATYRPGGGLVIALHGAGGDENMFPDGYGNGIIKKLAESTGTIVVSPSTTAVVVAPVTLQTIIDTMIRERAIDPAKTSILGHSMGAAAAMRAVDALPGTFRSWSAIGGAGTIPRDESTRGLIVLGGLDPLANPARIMPTIRRSENRDRVRVDLHEQMGHTLLVGAVLPHVMEWLATE